MSKYSRLNEEGERKYNCSPKSKRIRDQIRQDLDCAKGSVEKIGSCKFGKSITIINGN
jgi:hypothetical protein